MTVARQINATIHHAFGYAYAVTGDTQYLTMGDDMFGASFGDATDTVRNLAADAGGKEYDQNFRSSGRYLAWRLGSTTPPNGTPVNVTWTNILNATASGSSLTATAVNGRGESTQSITSGNGSLSVTMTHMGDTDFTYVGLINGSFTGTAETGYAWKIYNGIAFPWLNSYGWGYGPNSYISTASGDTFEVRINGTTVEWYRNNSPVYSLPGQTLTYPYRAAAFFTGTMSPKIASAQMTGAQ